MMNHTVQIVLSHNVKLLNYFFVCLFFVVQFFKDFGVETWNCFLVFHLVFHAVPRSVNPIHSGVVKPGPRPRRQHPETVEHRTFVI